MHDAIIISDIHLGSEACQAKTLHPFLDTLAAGKLTRQLVLNGDVFDSWDFRRLKGSHWKVLSALRGLSDIVPVTWINGNHDGPAEIVSHLLGLDVATEYVLESGGKKILILHGHIFDNFITDHPFIVWAADGVYTFLQKIDPSFYWAKLAKRSSKSFLRCASLVEERAKIYAKKKGCDAVCCGHTHYVSSSYGTVEYHNSGCWTETPCVWLGVKDGVITTHTV